MSDQIKSTKNLTDITNKDFVDAIFGELPKNISYAGCTLVGDPDPVDKDEKAKIKFIAQRSVTHFSQQNNNYATLAAYHDDGGRFSISTSKCAGVYAILLDDIGTKAPKSWVISEESSWFLETSPGNYQAGFIFTEPASPDVAAKVVDTLINYKLCDPGAKGPATRWARLPVGINGKAKYRDANGTAFQCRLECWRPNKRQSPEGVLQLFDLDMPAPVPVPVKRIVPKGPANAAAIGIALREIASAPQGGRRPVLIKHSLRAAEDIVAGRAAYDSVLDSYAQAGGLNGITRREIDGVLRWAVKAKNREADDRAPRDEVALYNELIKDFPL